MQTVIPDEHRKDKDINNVEGYVYVGQCYNLKEKNQYKEIPTEDRDNTDGKV